jgi:uncharacterized protein YegP (UPF0339 family)
MKHEPKIEIHQGEFKSPQWYWHCRSGNGRIVMDGSEGYDSKRNVKRAIARLKDAGILPRDLKVVEL